MAPTCRFLAILIVSLVAASGARAEHWRVVRLPGNPIVRPGMPNLTGPDADNINGPSLIRVPSWVKNPLGKYYLYFAHHAGNHIRLAYADSLTGPWKVHAGGILGMHAAGFDNHIASPDVHIDDQSRRVIMYYHGMSRKREPGQPYHQPARVAVSSDGLSFEPKPQDLGEGYFRVFRWRAQCYAIAKNGELFRSRSCSEPWAAAWEHGGNPFPRTEKVFPRHVATLLNGDTLTVHYSRIGDEPEHLMVSTIHLSEDWKNWRASEPVSVLRPEQTYEGSELPVRPSKAGLAVGRVHELRDPAVYVEGKQKYLLYSVAGENGIAIAKLE
jgi:hypothetical protein